jgi:uncharacterized protein YjbI with pentapeptide repeats
MFAGTKRNVPSRSSRDTPHGPRHLGLRGRTFVLVTSTAEHRRSIFRWALWLILAILAAAVIIYLLIWYGPDVLAHHDIGNVTGPLRVSRLEQARDAARGRLLTLGAGIFAAGALVYTARNFSLSRRTFELTEQGQVTDRYTRAIEQLGSKTIDVTIGGIYALERIARDSPRDHPTVMEVLAACIREHSRKQWPKPSKKPGTELPERATRADVQAALTVIGRRDRTHDQQPINLTGANLTRSDLHRADLADVDLTGVNLTGANLTDANLTSARLASANLTSANLTSANLTYADLTSADFTGANLNVAFLTGASLTDTILTGANLTFARLTGANLTDKNLTGANLTAAELTRARLTGANLTEATLIDAFLDGADLTGANFTGTDLTGAFDVGQIPSGWVPDPEEPDRLSRADGEQPSGQPGDGPGSAAS